MAYKISDACIACGVCVDQCPTNCISEGDPIYVIAAEDCIACGACAGVCPVSACVQE
jgi:ferredoxin